MHTLFLPVLQNAIEISIRATKNFDICERSHLRTATQWGQIFHGGTSEFSKAMKSSKLLVFLE